jgi:hypothetical protein
MKTQTTTLFIRRIIILFIVLLFLVGLSWYAGIQLGVFQQIGLFNNPDTNRVTVSTDPAGASVWINDNLAGVSPLKARIPKRDISIRVEMEQYETYEERFDQLLGDSLFIPLRFNIHTELISTNSHPAGWDQEGRLAFFDFDALMLHFRNVDGEIERSIEISSFAKAMGFSVNNDMIGIGEGPLASEIFFLPSISDQAVVVGYGGAAPCWHPSNGQYFFLGWTGDTHEYDMHLWAGRPGEEPIRVALPDNGKIRYPISTSWSGDGRYFLVQSLEHADIWNFSNGSLTYSGKLPAIGSDWAPGGAMLAYLDAMSNLYVYDADTGSKDELSTNLPFEDFAWSPDGLSLFGVTYNPTIGGSAFWEIDVEKGSSQLLIDSEEIFGKVTDMAVSPDGTRIAYLNDLGQLGVLIIGE